jgi:hypothetical protein
VLGWTLDLDDCHRHLIFGTMKKRLGRSCRYQKRRRSPKPTEQCLPKSVRHAASLAPKLSR